jgi:hypothetical protein
MIRKVVAILPRNLPVPGIVLIAVFLVSLGLMHVIHPAVNCWKQPVSWYLAMEFGILLRIGFMAFGLAEILLGIHFIYRGKRGAALFCIAGLGAVLSGIFIMDHNPGETTMQENLHNYAASLQFISIPPVAFRIFFRERRRGYKILSLITGLVTAFLFTQMLIGLNRMDPVYLEHYGISQRLLILWIAAYMLILAVSEIKGSGQKKTE